MKDAMRGSLVITQQPSENGVVIVLDGDLDFYTYPRFENVIAALLIDQKYNLIIDCRNLSYIGSSGLGGFIDIMQRCKKNGGTVEFINFNEKIWGILGLLGFVKVLNAKRA
jgi:anti-sigma B factor antagonist